MDEHRLEFESDANVNRAAVVVLKARDVSLTGSAAGLVAAKGNVSFERAGAGPVLANGLVTFRYGGCEPVMANGDVSFEYGGAQTVLAAGGVRIGPKAGAAVVLSPRVTVEDGGRVLLSSKQAAIFGAAAGIVFALVSRLVRR